MAFRLSEHQRETIRKSIADGLSYSEAAERAGCNISTAKSYARRVRLQSPRTLLWDRQRALSHEGKRQCPQCKEEKPLDAFRIYDGRAKYSYCLDCCRANERERASVPALRFSRILNAAKNRATRKSVPFQITADDIHALWENQGGVCHYTGEHMTLDPNQRNTISLDRVRPDKGYVVGNVVLCCDIVNKMKWDMDDSEMVTWCRRVVERADSKV